MAQSKASSSQSHDSGQVASHKESPKADVKSRPIPKKRNPKVLWNGLCFLVTALIIVYAIFRKASTLEYVEDKDFYTKMVQNLTVGTCYQKDEKKNYPLLINLGLTLSGTILAVFVYRVCNFLEDLLQLQRRYHGSIFQLVKHCCCSGTLVKVAIGLAFVVLIACGAAKNFHFELGDLLYILGPIGVSPFLTHLFGLNTQSDGDISRFLEERGLNAGCHFATLYYSMHLKKTLKVFRKCFPNNNAPVQDQGSGERSDGDPLSRVRLTFKKYILLLSHNCKTKDNLADVDNNIIKLGDIPEDGYNFPVYRLTCDGQEDIYVIQYAKGPLKALAKIDGNPKSFESFDHIEYQVEQLYNKLSEILARNDPGNEECLLVLTKEEAHSLQNSGLTKLIVSNVRADETNKPKRFLKLTTSARKTGQPKETDDTSASNKEDSVRCNSIVVDIDRAEGIAPDNRLGLCIPDDADTYSEDDELGRLDERGKAPLNPKLQVIKGKMKDKSRRGERRSMALSTDETYRSSQNDASRKITTMLSKNQARENGSEITRPPVSSKPDKQQLPTNDDRQPATSHKPDALGHSQGPENRASSNFVVNREICQRGVENESPTDDNPTVSDCTETTGSSATCSSTIVDIDLTKGNVRYNKMGYLVPADNEDENSTLLLPTED